MSFITELIREVGTLYRIDADRVYASGMSNGGGLPSMLALALPDTFAAVGSVAGLYTQPPASRPLRAPCR